MSFTFITLETDHFPKAKRDVGVIITFINQTLPLKLIINISHQVSKQSIVLLR